MNNYAIEKIVLGESYDYEVKTKVKNKDNCLKAKIITGVALFSGATVIYASSANYRNNITAPEYTRYRVVSVEGNQTCMKSSENYNLNMIINMDKIRHMKNFEKNWDGDDASAFSSEDISLFEKVIEGLTIQPDISPTGRKSLLLEYENGNDYLAYELSNCKVSQVKIINGDYNSAECLEFSCEDCTKIINEKVEEFYEQGMC